MQDKKAFVIDGKVVQVIDPIYKMPREDEGFKLSYPFYSPYKYFFGYKVKTLIST